MKKTFTSTDWKRLAAMKDSDINTQDIPELGPDFFEKAQYRTPAQQTVTLQLDSDVLTWFQQQDISYQTRINQLLRLYMLDQNPSEKHG